MTIEKKSAPRAKKEDTKKEDTKAHSMMNDVDDFDAPDLDMGYDEGRDRKMFAKRKSDWFIAKKIKPDWKDPSTYSWLVSEFGKIQPARMTGLTPKNHRLAVAAIKRGRQMGLISYLSNYVAK